MLNSQTPCYLCLVYVFAFECVKVIIIGSFGVNNNVHTASEAVWCHCPGDSGMSLYEL